MFYICFGWDRQFDALYLHLYFLCIWVSVQIQWKSNLGLLPQEQSYYSFTDFEQWCSIHSFSFVFIKSLWIHFVFWICYVIVNWACPPVKRFFLRINGIFFGCGICICIFCCLSCFLCLCCLHLVFRGRVSVFWCLCVFQCLLWIVVLLYIGCWCFLLSVCNVTR